MKILVTGINGQVGWEVLRQGEARGCTMVGLDRVGLDISRAAQVQAVMTSEQPQLVINCAAYTAVDKAEEDSDTAYSVNQQGPANLSAACADQGIPLIHLSTDYVFDGMGTTPYREDEPVCPLGVYGRSKEAGEQEVRSRLAEHIILRTAWVYGVQGHNFVKTMLRLAGQYSELKVVADQWGCPTAAADLGRVVLDLAEEIAAGNRQWGTYHCCGATATTWHGFAERIFALCPDSMRGQVEKVTAITTVEYPTPAKRPAYSVLDCAKLRDNYQITMPELDDSLQLVLAELAQEGKRS